MTDTAIPQDVRDLAAGIADDIAALGHFQGPTLDKTFWGVDRPTEPCCIVANPHMRSASDGVASQLLEVLVPEDVPVTRWNDTIPTAEVLATLRRIAAGERP